MQPVFLLDYNLKSTEFYLCLLVSSAVMVSISFVSLYIGLQMRSSKATIISSVVLMFLTQGNIGDFTLAGNTVFYCLLLVVSLLFVVLSIYRVETRDLRWNGFFLLTKYCHTFSITNPCNLITHFWNVMRYKPFFKRKVEDNSYTISAS